MIIALLALAAAADGDEVGGVVMGQTADFGTFECRDDRCQKRGEVAGQQGAWAVQHCGGVATGATFSVTYVPDTGAAAGHFQHIATHVADPEADAQGLRAQWVHALQSSGWQIHEERQDLDGSEWVRLVLAPHARLVRVRSTNVGGIKAYTTSMQASATDPSCPRP